MQRLADESGVAIGTISYLEAGSTRHPNPRTVERLNAALGLHVRVCELVANPEAVRVMQGMLRQLA